MVNGYVFYNGPSEIDGTPIIGIVTIKTKNEKTGPMVQTWILPRDENPFEAIHNGNDVAVCGNCPLRGIIEDNKNKHRGCYVAVHNAPNNIWKAFHRGMYPKLTKKSEGLSGKSLRFGAYGDPVAIPWNSWMLLEELCTGRITAGYTHQWKDKRFQAWKKHIMASIHSVEEKELAHSMGWRTFRTGTSSEGIDKDEIFCPASPEGGDKRQCNDCGACNGNYNGGTERKSIFIIQHGGIGRLSGIQRVHDMAGV